MNAIAKRACRFRASLRRELQGGVLVAGRDTGVTVFHCPILTRTYETRQPLCSQALPRRVITYQFRHTAALLRSLRAVDYAALIGFLSRADTHGTFFSWLKLRFTLSNSGYFPFQAYFGAQGEPNCLARTAALALSRGRLGIRFYADALLWFERRVDQFLNLFFCII